MTHFWGKIGRSSNGVFQHQKLNPKLPIQVVSSAQNWAQTTEKQLTKKESLTDKLGLLGLELLLGNLPKNDRVTFL